MRETGEGDDVDNENEVKVRTLRCSGIKNSDNDGDVTRWWR